MTEAHDMTNLPFELSVVRGVPLDRETGIGALTLGGYLAAAIAD